MMTETKFKIDPPLGASHPAKFNNHLMTEFRQLLIKYNVKGLILDPFAGTGKIHELRNDGYTTFGIEIEPEWAEMSPYTAVGDATKLPEFWTGNFAAVITSPTYGNRMSDHHDAKERCSKCGGNGWISTKPGPYQPNTLSSFRGVVATCDVCDGTGRREYKRLTYKHQLGRDLSPNNSGAMPFGEKYKDLHRVAWREVWRVLEPGGYFFLNIKDHIKNGEEVQVSLWHRETIEQLGFTWEEISVIKTPSMKFGTNRDARIEHEYIYTFKKAA